MDSLKIQELLFRNIDQIIPSKDFFLSKIEKKEKIRIYLGIDPTGPLLHIGHLSTLKKMKHFQEAGLEVVILMGGMTGRIGDPTGKSTARNQLTKEEIEKNISQIKKQIEKVIKFDGENPAKIMDNYDWLSKLNFEDVINLSSNITHEQMIERDMFQDRLKNHEPIYMHEFMYPLMQGYDSVALDTDAELGGTDQLFNMMMGRTLLKKLKSKEKFVLTVPLLTDSQGKKIGKSEGNVIPFGNDKPYETYAGMMTLGDDVIIKCFVALTDVDLEEISIIETDIVKNKANPMIYKKQLAYTLVKETYGELDAKKCQEEFEKTVQNKEFSETQTVEVEIEGEMRILDFLRNNLKGFSGSEIKLIIEQNGLLINSEKVKNLNETIKKGDEVKFGKKNYFKIK